MCGDFLRSRDAYFHAASGTCDDGPGLVACLKAVREGDLLVVWKLDQLGRDLRHLVNTVHDLTARGAGFKVLSGHGSTIDPTSASGKLVFGIFAALAKFSELCTELGITRQNENHHRRYQITVGCDLLNDWTVIIRYGRTGQGGR